MRAQDRLSAFCRHNKRLCLGLAAVIALLSLWLLQAAVGQRGLPVTLLLTGAGVGVGALALLLVNELWVDFMSDDAGKQRGKALGVRVCLVAACGLALGLWMSDGLMTAISLFSMMIGLLALQVWFGGGAVTCPLCWVGFGFLAMAGGVLLLAASVGSIPVSGGLWIVGLTVFKAGILPLIDQLTPVGGALLLPEACDRVRSLRARAVLVLGLAATIGGGISFRIGIDGEMPILLLVGLMLGITGLTMVGIAGLRVGLQAGARRWFGWPVFGLGVGCAFVGGWLVLVAVGDWRSLILVFSLALAALGMFFVFRGEGLLLLVFVAVVLIWVLHDHNSQEQAATAEGTPGVLALGDSFMSGEGAADFVAGTNTKDPSGNTCRRAQTAYSVLAAAAQDPPMATHSLACSGAKMQDILTVGQKGAKQLPGSPIAGWLPQLASLGSTTPSFISPQDRAAIEVVLVSIGGNDAGFTTLIETCLLPANCAEDRNAWLSKAESIEDQLVDTYRQISAAVPDADIVVVPYPEFVGAQQCKRAVSKEEFAFVAELIGVLNRTIYRAADTAGVLVADTRGVFEGHQQCDDEPGVNLVVLAPPAGPLGQRLKPGSWIHGSMHPWELGHELQAARVTPLVGALRAGAVPDRLVADGLIINLSDVDVSRSRLTDQQRVAGLARAGRLLGEAPDDGGHGAGEGAEGESFARDQLYDSAAAVLVPVGLLLFGGLLMAVGLTRANVPFAVFMAPELPGEPWTEHQDFQLSIVSQGVTRGFWFEESDTANVLVTLPCSKLTVPSGVRIRDVDSGADYGQVKGWQFFQAGRHPFWFAKAAVELAPGAVVVVQAESKDDGINTSAPARLVGLPTRETSTLSLTVGSCVDRGNAALVSELVDAYERLGSVDHFAGFDPEHALHLWIGDQVYLDAPWKAGFRAADALDTISGKYLDAWEIGAGRDPTARFGKLLRDGSNWFLPDDHEFWNGYPAPGWFTLPVHTMRRLWRQRRKIGRVDSHPVDQGEFGRAAGHAYAVFQSPVALPKAGLAPESVFDAQVMPTQVQRIDFDQVRIVLADTRWSRTIVKSFGNAGFMRKWDFRHLTEQLDTDALVVLVVAKPMLGFLPKQLGRFTLDPGAESFSRQYRQLMLKIAKRAEVGRPTLILGGDVHHHSVKTGLNDRVLEVVSSPMVRLRVGSEKSLAARMMELGRWASKSKLFSSTDPTAFEDLAGQPIRGRWYYPADEHHQGADSGIVGLHLQFTEDGRPRVRYALSAVGEESPEPLLFEWRAGKWRELSAVE